MNTGKTLALGMLTLLLTFAVAWGVANPPKETAAPNTAPVVQGANQFACQVYGALAQQKEGNLFFSPASIHAALAMTYAGAAGQTAEQMAKVLQLPADAGAVHAAYGELLRMLNDPSMDDQGKPAYDLAMVNALWAQKGFALKPAFMHVLTDTYRAEPRQLDFAQSEPSRKAINDWVAQQTKDKIQDLIPQGVLDGLTRLVLTNAVYFKGRWDRGCEFDKHDTKEGPFHAPGGKDVQVPMMHQQYNFSYLETDAFQAVKLLYVRHELSMIVLLPKAADSLAGLERSLTGEALTAWDKKMQSEEVKLTLPKFKFTCALGLNDLLKKMGMTDAFSAEKADFSGITEAEKLFISAVLHKAFVAVDEEGTEAAAATAVAVGATAMPMPREPKVFTADHPFVFLIQHHKTGAILFLGRVSNPQAL